MTPAKKGMLMSSALADGRNREGGGALENGKASMISALRSRSRPMRCSCAERDSSAPAKAGSKSERRAWMAHFQLNSESDKTWKRKDPRRSLEAPSERPKSGSESIGPKSNFAIV